MARPSSTALLLFLLSLLAVAHCRTLESEPAADASTAETTTTLTIGDETSSPNPADVTALAVPEEQHAFLSLPFHQRHRHRPCRHGLFHRHLWWARHHGNLFGDGHRFHRDGEPRVAEADTEEVKPVAEPDPDRAISLPGSDGEGEEGDDTEAVKRWRRMFRHGLRHHRRAHGDGEPNGAEAAEVKAVAEPDPDRSITLPESDGKEDGDDTEAVKRWRRKFRHGLRHHRHHHHEEEEEEEKMRKPFHFHHADDDVDGDLEEMVRLFRKAIMSRRRFHHHGHHHHYAEQADGEQQHEEGGGVMTWVKGVMNRF